MLASIFNEYLSKEKMMKSNLPSYGMVLLLLFSFAGCAPLPLSVSDSSALPELQAVSPPVEQTEQLGISSLEAFRSEEGSSYSLSRQSSSGPVKEIYFDFDSYVLIPSARQILKGNSEWLRKHPSVMVEVEGHADDRGTGEYNLALGSKRAQVVMEYLSALGISSNRLSTVSYGEELPVCREKTEECWQRNRRAHFVITSSESVSLK
jgi:peptidoglycan-associated lipoprotein